jgi:hypothetical protein
MDQVSTHDKLGSDGHITPPKYASDKGSKTRLVTMAHLDRRTAAAQVAKATRDAIMGDLGGEDRLSTLERIMVENASMSAAVLRDAHVRWMNGEPVPVSEIATLENTFNRTAAALGTARRARDITPDIAAYGRSAEKPDRADNTGNGA